MRRKIQDQNWNEIQRNEYALFSSISLIITVLSVLLQTHSTNTDVELT